MEQRDTTEEDSEHLMRDGGREGVTAPRRGSAEALTLTFEAGRAVASEPFDLGAFEAVTLGRERELRASAGDDGGHLPRLTVGIGDRRMSLAHAHLRRTPDGWLLEDCRSKNGTRVNGVRVDSALLRSGDLIEVGRSFLVFRKKAAGRTDHLAVECGRLPAGLTTANPGLARGFRQLTLLAPSRVSIEIGGETGTGKEVVARAVHGLSGRPGAFQAINCGALPRSLLESELFGYRKGAFSGAGEHRPGLIRAASGGTLFLDEIGDLALDAQVALLRVLQEEEVVPVGGTEPVPVDIRVVSASHRDLPAMAASGLFRPDLLARLTGFAITLPPLRHRLEDMGSIVRALLVRHAPGRAGAVELSPPVIRALHGHSWPLNVRELEKAISTALVLCGGEIIEIDHLPEALRSYESARPANAAAEHGSEDEQRDVLARLLALHKGNVTTVAAELRTSRMQVHRLCRRFGFDVASYRSTR